jgi:hypothetical protein
MPQPKDTLDRIEIPKPCDASWDEMIGNEEVRFCVHCQKSVHNISAMTRKAAVKLAVRSGGALCVRFYRRDDDTVHTTDSAVRTPLHQLTRRASRLVAGTFGAAISLASSAVVANPAAPSELRRYHGTISAPANMTRVLDDGDASLAGKVTDPQGAVIPGAIVILINNQTKQELMTSTDSEGEFLFKFLESGRYILKASARDFRTSANPVVIEAGQTRRQDCALGLLVVVSGGGMVTLPDEPMLAAVLNGDIDEIKALIAAGVPIDVIDKEYDSTPLAQAVANGRIDIVKLLLWAGADANIRDSKERTPLMALDEDSRPEMVHELVRSGAKLELQDSEGKSALFIVSESNVPLLLQALVDAGATVNARDNDDQTALMRAAYYENPENVEVLLRAGADVNLKDKEGKTALALAIEEDCPAAADILRAYNAVD